MIKFSCRGVFWIVLLFLLVGLCSFLPFLIKSYQVKLPVEVKEQSLTQGNVNYTLINTDSEEDKDIGKDLFVYTSKVSFNSLLL